MLFQSYIFIIFFIVFYTVYLRLSKNYKLQNILLLIASYIFYGYWDWRFLFLLGLSTIIDFSMARLIGQAEDPKKRKLFITVSVVCNLTILGFFKYFNFFADSAGKVLELFGFQGDFITLNIILPVGISFYTFQSLSYTIDVYRGVLKPAKSLLDFAVYISFFPQLVAGPIERAVDLLPQVTSPRVIRPEQVNAGIFLILWGYFKKLVIADNLAKIANVIFNNSSSYEGVSLIVGILAFTVQIYGDFSGYSDIARGLSKLMGFDLMLNFNLPFFAINPSDFWARWHISLSTWLKDYLYIPLGGNRQGTFNTYRNLFLTMLLGGLWHGAAWNFVIWGAFQGLILIIYRIFDKNPEHLDPWSGKYSYVRVVGKMFLMFVLANIGWVIFRSNSVSQILYILTHVSLSGLDTSGELLFKLIFFSLPLIIIQLGQYISKDLLFITKLGTVKQMLIYSFFVVWILIFGVRESSEFIYFQF